MKNNPIELKIYGEIGSVNDGKSFTDTLENLEKEGCKNLTIRLHTYGGSVFEGVAMFNALQRSKIHIKIVVDGVAASMGSLLLMAVNEVEIADNGFIMIHSPVTTTSGNAKEHSGSAKLLLDIENNFARQYAAITGLTENEIRDRWFDGKDHWINAADAVKIGLANRVIPGIVKNIELLDINSFTNMNYKNVYNKYAAIFNTKNNSEMKKKLIEMFDLKELNEESSDTAVLIRLKEIFDGLKQQIENKSLEEEKANEKAVKSILNAAFNDKKITASEITALEKLGKDAGSDMLLSVISMMSKKQPLVIASLIKDTRTTPVPGVRTGKDKSEWTLKDYRMFAPKELLKNPGLYEKLIKNEFNQD